MYSVNQIIQFTRGLFLINETFLSFEVCFIVISSLLLPSTKEGDKLSLLLIVTITATLLICTPAA